VSIVLVLYRIFGAVVFDMPYTLGCPLIKQECILADKEEGGLVDVWENPIGRLCQKMCHVRIANNLILDEYLAIDPVFSKLTLHNRIILGTYSFLITPGLPIVFYLLIRQKKSGLIIAYQMWPIMVVCMTIITLQWLIIGVPFNHLKVLITFNILDYFIPLWLLIVMHFAKHEREKVKHS